MNDLEQYLKKATQGVPTAEKRRLVEELRGSVLERAAELQLSGLDKEQALRSALREFGDPRPLAAGMRGVHLWPRVSLFGALSMSLMAVTLLNWPHALGQQVQITTEGLVPRCTLQGPPNGAKTCSVNRSAWVDIDSLTQQLRQQGVTVTHKQEARSVPAIWKVPHNAVQETILTASWRENGHEQSFKLPLSDRVGDAFHTYMHSQRPANQPGFDFISAPSETVFQRGTATFLDVERLTSALLDSATLPVRIENPLDAPTIYIGRVRLSLGQPQQGAQMSGALTGEVMQLLYTQYRATTYYGVHYLPSLDDIRSSARGFAQQVQVKGRPGEIYAVLFPVTAQKVNGLGFDLVAVNRNGQLKFRTAQEKVAFTGNVKALANGGEQKAAVVLLRLGNPVTLEKNTLLEHTIEMP